MELSGIALIFLLTLLLAWPLGRYMAGVFSGEWEAPAFVEAFEQACYRLARINPARRMTWVEQIEVLLVLQIGWFLWTMLLLMTQQYHGPLNPDGNPSMSPDLAFNTAVSFLVNCNLQHYSGETGLSYLSQIGGLMFLQFVTAATGLAIAAAVWEMMRPVREEYFTSFYVLLMKSCTRILLPLSLVFALLLALEGVPMTFEGAAKMRTLEGDTVQLARGPVAAMVAIKQAGTNGGGFFGVNSAHPFENPSYLTNVFENVLILLLPIALIFGLGQYLGRPRLAYMIFGVMTAGFLLLLVPTLVMESQGTPGVAGLGVDQSLGSMEGKEIRFGVMASAYWGITTTVTSNGSVNAMHDSFTALSGAFLMLGMMVNALYGGVGVGFLNFYLFIILSVFISGLMVGRTPEFLGKKIEAREMKIATLIVLLHPLLILGGTALATALIHRDSSLGWLNNPGSHGFSEMLYEYTSASANNGSGFEGLGDNTPFWNISTGIVLLLARYLPIIGPVAIAGLLAAKKFVPAGAGTLPTDTTTFGVMTLVVILMVAALSFFPALTLGPVAEYVMSR